MWGLAASLAGGALLGGFAGAQGQRSSSSSTTSYNLAPETKLEKKLNPLINQDYDAYRNLIGAGAGQGDVATATGQQRSFADMLNMAATGQGLAPTQQDFDLAKMQFSGAQEGLNQSFQDAQVQAARMAAKLGRPVNDPILQAKMFQEQTRQQRQLDANVQGAATALPQQRINLMANLTDVRNNLAQQAMSNRTALLSLGNQLKQQDRDFRRSTASTTQFGQGVQGGGTAGMISGALAGMGGMAGAYGSLSSLFNQQPRAPQAQMLPASHNAFGGAYS
jgi:hypothetical protein